MTGGEGGATRARGDGRVANDNPATPVGTAGQSIEVTARTVDDAVARALRQLGVSRHAVTVEVLHAGSPGRLLGFGAEPARVRVSVNPFAESDVTDQDSLASVDEDASPEASFEAGDDGADTEDGEGAAESTGAADAGLARMMLVELLQQMGVLGVRVEVAGTSPVTLNIRGPETADLIGRRGEHLRALQFILSLMVNKQLHRHVRVIVDVDGYRSRREELLRGLAQRIAHRVRATQEPVQLEAMPPNERRIIHMVLAEEADVMTESTGEGDARRVVVMPRR